MLQRSKAAKLLDMYLRSGSPEAAWPIFLSLPSREQDTVAWTRMMAANAQVGNGGQVFRCFHMMQLEGVAIDRVSFVTLLTACAGLGREGLAVGRRIHGYIRERQMNDVVLANALLSMYGKQGLVATARCLFDGMEDKDLVSWTSIISACAQHDDASLALSLFRQMQQAGVAPSKVTLVAALSAVTGRKDLHEGRRIHAQVAETGLCSDLVVGNALLSMYPRCGCLQDTVEVFAGMTSVDVISWNVVIAAHAQSGDVHHALHFFQLMLLQGETPTRPTFISLLTACTGRVHFRRLHSLLLERGWDSEVVVANCLIGVCSKLDGLPKARSMFDSMQRRDLVSWSAMLSAYAQHGESAQAFVCFRKMQLDGVTPNQVTLLTALSACDNVADASRIHSYVRDKHHPDPALVSALVSVYAKCGSLSKARQLFDEAAEDGQGGLVLWNTVIAAYAQQHSHQEEAMQLFREMQLAGVKPDAITFCSLLVNGCTSRQQGRWLHRWARESGLDSALVVRNALLSMYGRWGALLAAVELFDLIPRKDTVSWNAVITAASAMDGPEAAILFRRMNCEGAKCDRITFMALLPSCCFLSEGKLLHSNIVELGLDSDAAVANALVSMYARCGSLESARAVFQNMPCRNTVSWNAMIAAYVEDGEQVGESLLCFWEMQLQGFKPSPLTLITALNACTAPRHLRHGMSIHSSITEWRVYAATTTPAASELVLGNALAAMYSRCASTSHVKSLFDEMQERDVVTWNALLLSHTQQEGAAAGLHSLRSMLLHGFKPDGVTFLNLLHACSKEAALSVANAVHKHRVDAGYGADVKMGNMVLAVNARYSLTKAIHLFWKEMANKDVVSWNTILAAHARRGLGDKKPFELFHAMQLHGFCPDGATFATILCSCSHSGGVLDACGYFYSMLVDYGIAPDVEHYGCIIDLLGRAGWLAEVEAFMLKMPIRANDAMWMSLINACSIHGNVDVARHAASKFINLKPEEPSGFVCLSNVLTNA